jgi:hypothetical protein
MKLLIIIIFIFSAHAETPKKTYSEEEFRKKVFEEVKSKVDTIKNKSVSDLTKELLDKEEKNVVLLGKNLMKFFHNL